MNVFTKKSTPKASLAVLLALSFLAVSCSNNKPNPIIPEEFTNPDMKFVGEPLFLVNLKLKSPALLTTAVRGADNKYTVDQGLKEKILAEQEEMIAKIKEISPDINIIYKYRLALNALAVEAPQKYADQISELDADLIVGQEMFKAPKVFKNQETGETTDKKTVDITTKNSMTYIGARKVNESLKALNTEGKLVSVKGQGVKVGIIDSGIDYTHAMLGGSGDKADFEKNDPNVANANFPNKKVVGGRDFVGAKYGASPHIYGSYIPVPDVNPLDTTGHGSHVAGTVGGKGDGINTYDGAAPEVDLYALKVFGDLGGGTGDNVVIAALEYAMDPNGDLNVDDKLDVVNMSLGSEYGKPHTLYNEAVTNVITGGLIVVASGGNAGPVPNIVGSPGVAENTISVAALRDDMDHNVEFGAAEFTLSGGDKVLGEAIEGSITTQLSEIKTLTGKLVYVGDASVDLTEEQKIALKGHVALIDRGKVSFVDKITRAVAAGATGVVMLNNKEGDPISMGGEVETPFAIPGVMTTKAIGDQLKKDMENGDVSVDFKTSKKIRKENLIGTITSFSSQGPRSLDAKIKPEIAAPGQQIISARMGTGNEGVKFNGTSMSAPHTAGVAALLVQYRRNLNPLEVKSLIMNSSKLILDKDGKKYSVSRQGAGMIRAYEAATMQVAFSKPSISLGRLAIQDKYSVTKRIKVKNFTDTVARYTLSVLADDSIKVELSKTALDLAAGEEVSLKLNIAVIPTSDEVSEVDAFIQIKSGAEVVGNLPILAVVSRTTAMRVKKLNINADGYSDSAGKTVTATIKNNGEHDGEALLFNLLSRDVRKKPSKKEMDFSVACDLQSAGYRIVERAKEAKTPEEKERTVMTQHLQIAVKVFNPVSGWEACDIGVEVDVDGDSVSDKDLTGSTPKDFPGFEDDGKFDDFKLTTMVFNAAKLREIQTAHAAAIARQPDVEPEQNYVLALEALETMKAYRSSTIAIVEVPIAIFGDAKGVHLRVTSSYNGGYIVEREDVLGEEGNSWKKISLEKENAGYYNLPESITVKKGEEMDLDFTKGSRMGEELVVYYPRNKFTRSKTAEDKQSQTPTLKFK